MTKITAKTTLEDLAITIAEHLQNKGLQATLVGGAVVTIYSDNEYQSRDLDFISPHDHQQIAKAMRDLGFESKGKDFSHPHTKFTVEFPTGPIAIGNAIPVKAEGVFSNSHGKVKMLSPTQCVMDRLAWFYHYNDRQCLDQALAVAKNHPIKIASIKKWSKAEGTPEKFEIFLEKLKAVK